MQDRGFVAVNCPLQRRSELFSGFDSLAMAAESEGIGGEIRIAQLRRRYPARIMLFLVHAYGAVDAVIDKNDDDGKLILNCRGEFLSMHHETTVSGKTDYGFGRVQPLGGDRRRQAIAHRSRGRSQLRAVALEVMKAMQPSRIVPRAVAQYGVGRQYGFQMRHQLSHLQRSWIDDRPGIGP